MHTSKAKHGINSPLSLSRQVFSHHQDSRAPSHLMATWEVKCHHFKHPPPPFSFLYSQMYMLYMEYPFSQLGSAGPALYPQILVYPQPACWWGGVTSRVYRCCSAIMKRSLCYQPCFQHKSKLATVKMMNSLSAKTSTLLKT